MRLDGNNRGTETENQDEKEATLLCVNLSVNSDAQKHGNGPQSHGHKKINKINQVVGGMKS